MRVLKHSIAPVLALALTGLIFAAPGWAQTPTRTFTVKYSSGQPGTNPKVVAARRLGQLIEERTKGTVKFQYFDSAQLYQDRDEPLAIRQGTVQMVVSALVFMDAIVPNTQLYGLPFMFGVDPRKAESLAKSDIGKQIEREAEQKLGARALGTWYSGTTMYAATKPLRTIDDFKGLRIRVAGSKLWEEYARVLGGSPIAISPGELFTAAQQGLIDANDSNASAIAGLKLWQVMKYGIRTHHSTIVHMVLFNGAFWRGLPADLQKTIEQATAEVTEWEWDNGIKLLDEAYARLVENGMTIHTPSDAELDKFRDRLLPLQQTYLRDNPDIDKELVRRAEAFVKK